MVLTRRETVVRYHTQMRMQSSRPLPMVEQPSLELARSNTTNTTLKHRAAPTVSPRACRQQPGTAGHPLSSSKPTGSWPDRTITARPATGGSTLSCVESINSSHPLAVTAGSAGAEPASGTENDWRTRERATPSALLVPNDHGRLDGATAYGWDSWHQAGSLFDGGTAAASPAATGSSRSSTSCAPCQDPARLLRPHHTMHAGTDRICEHKGVRSLVTTHRSFEERGGKQEGQWQQVQSLHLSCACGYRQTSQLPIALLVPDKPECQTLQTLAVRSERSSMGSIQAGIESGAAEMAAAKLTRHQSGVAPRKGDRQKHSVQSPLEVVCPRGWLDGTSESQPMQAKASRERGDGSVMRMQMKQWFNSTSRNSQQLQIECKPMISSPDKDVFHALTQGLYPDSGLAAVEALDGVILRNTVSVVPRREAARVAV